ncbi:MAG TPA: metal-dependent hydrolase [Candidatus Nanoarchaeia archaeon]|nr:metal-dependent hydrolase [Candidatus Nanoarchaeia archaeon]
MIKRTHFVIGLAFALLFLPHVNNKFIFFSVALICSLLPDIDSPNSYYGHHKIFRPLQWVSKHRGVFHSFTICIIASFAFAFFIPILALPFFLGYASHLAADSFTLEGITPFWPWKKTSNGFIRTGGHSEYPVFIGFLIIDALLFLRLFV